MIRSYTAAVATLAVMMSAAPAMAESSTIRIEPRPYYGAVVTIEQGVRVWRPLPSTKYVIINPEGKTPLNLGLTDVTKKSTSHNYFYDQTSRAEPTSRGTGNYVVPSRGDYRVNRYSNGGGHHGRGSHRGGHGHRGGGIR